MALTPQIVADLILQNAYDYNYSFSGAVDSVFRAMSDSYGYYNIANTLESGEALAKITWAKNIFATSEDMQAADIAQAWVYRTGTSQLAGDALVGGEASSAMAITDVAIDTTGAAVTATPVAAASAVGGTIATGGIAAAAGIITGVALYNTNPSFWNNVSANIASKTPWQWDDLPYAIKKVDGQYIGYIPYDAADAIISSMKNQGLFDCQNAATYNNYTAYASGTYIFPENTGRRYYDSPVELILPNNIPGLKIFFSKPTSSSNNLVGIYFIFDTSINRKLYCSFSTNSNGDYIGTVTKSAQYYEISFGGCYWVKNSTAYTWYNMDVSNNFLSNFINATVVQIGSYPNVTIQSGGVLPSTGDIKIDFPDWFKKAFTTRTVDKQGNIINQYWLPIMIPTSNPTINGNNDSQSDAQSGVVNITNTYQVSQIDNGADKQDNIAITVNPNFPIQTGGANGGNTPSTITPNGTSKALWTIYNPTVEQLNSLGGWLWSNNYIDQLAKMFNNPAEAIIGLHKIFVSPLTGDTQNIKVGYLDSSVPSKIVTKQYCTISCGSINLPEFFGNAEDYGAFTTLQIYLPFVGIVNLNVNDAMGGKLTVDYTCDVLTGGFVVTITIDRSGSKAILYQYGGSMGVQYPLSAGTYASVITSLLTTAAGVVGTVASGGALAPVALGGAMSLMNAKAGVTVSGGFSSCTGAMACKTPYLIIKRPVTANAYRYNSYYGYPNNLTVTLSNYKGFTKVKDVFTTVNTATDTEKTEIETLLKEGVLL